VVGRDLNVGEQTLMVTACGEAADPDRDRAVRKALLEYAGSRTRKAFQHGPLEHVERVAPPGYLEGFLPQVKRNLGTEENRALHDMVEWLRMPVQTLRAHMGVTLSHQRTVRFEELPQAHVTSDPKARCAEVVRQLTDSGFDILVADLSPEGHAVHNVKVIVPGLEVETMTYYRLGERNVARLLARDERLVGVGRAPAGCLHVRLTPQAEDRLGGHAWFNIEEAERRVGRLYALYREPERHSAQLMLRARRHGGGLS
jgi:ribosomal protein S12 methylthiotransferase accessory factor